MKSLNAVDSVKAAHNIRLLLAASHFKHFKHSCSTTIPDQSIN